MIAAYSKSKVSLLEVEGDFLWNKGNEVDMDDGGAFDVAWMRW